MSKIKNVQKLILCLAILFYIVIILFSNNSACAATRTSDLSKLINYPEIYTAVQEMKTAHPNWTFTILYTGLDWNEVLENETTKKHTRSLVQKPVILGDINDWICPICYKTPQDNGSWLCASNKTASYYIDPRNWINETYIFAFETLSFNSETHTLEGIKTMLSGSFMDTDSIKYIDTNGEEKIIEKSYAQIIFEAAKENGISPYHLASRILQEQGKGNSSLISGKREGFIGCYNYFNIGASGNNETEIIVNGLTRARDEQWNDPEKSIKGGAKFLKGGYIGNYQDTLYLQKYCVDNSCKYGLYGHQYQQNVSAPYTEGSSVYDAYEKLGILDSNFNFIIPVYENMPSLASVKPGRNLEIITEDVIVNTETTALTIRGGPGTGYYIKAKAPKGTKLVRIEKAVEPLSDGIYWDKVVYCTEGNIVIGYASREYLKETETQEIVNEEKTIQVLCALKNGPASTVNTRVKQILKPGTKVTVIDKIQYSSFGHTWYRVKLEDGTQGYVSSVYFEKEPEVKYKIDGTFVKVNPDTKITEIPEAVLTGEIFGTGAKIKIGETEYTLVMLGDVNGDGLVKSKDYMMIKNYIMGTLELSEAEKKAADVNKDGEIKSKDYMMIKNHIMNISTISL
jgi:beta-N-acetylglucosaminidase